ncbi:MAG: DEAD/DEAH box helicase, partial [Candidatus Odinarchaeota archaeon]
MDKDSTAGSVISEVFLSLSDSKHGELTLYAYQKEFINTEKRWLSLETPTGSGKTLALLGRVLLGQLLGDKNPDRNALFIYPTNELIN